MGNLDLKDYTDREIVGALVKLDFPKFIGVVNAIGAIVQKQEKRGKLISDQMSEDILEDLFRDIIEGKR